MRDAEGAPTPQRGRFPWVPDWTGDWVTWAQTTKLGWMQEFLLLWLWQRVGLDGVLERPGAPWRPEELAGDARKTQWCSSTAADLVSTDLLRYTQDGHPFLPTFVPFVQGHFPHSRPRLCLDDVLARYPEHRATWAHVDGHSAVQSIELETLYRTDVLVLRLAGGTRLAAQWPDVNRNGRYEAFQELKARARPDVPHHPRRGRPARAFFRNWRAGWVHWATVSRMSFLEEGFLRWFLMRADTLGALWVGTQPWTLRDFAEEYGLQPTRLRRLEGAVSGLLRRGALVRGPEGELRMPYRGELHEGRFPSDLRPRRQQSAYDQGGLF